MRFLDPGQAVFLLALPVAALFWLLHRRARGAFRSRAGIGSVARRLSRLSLPPRDVALLAMALLATGAIVFALARPQLLIETRQPEYERQDLVLVLDRSASMRAKDVAPSRFARAIHEIKSFLTHKPEGIDRVGLVGFAATSLIVSHLTRDTDSLFFYLDWIAEDSEPHFGTDIGAALASARELAKKDDRPTRKVFLVLSDGDDQGQQLGRQLAALLEERTRVHCIGIGSEHEVLIPLSREDGTTEMLLDEAGEPVRTRFDESTLRRVAFETGGRYFRSGSGDELLAAMREVARQERRIRGYKTTTEYRDLYRPALALAFAATLVLLVEP